MSIRMIDVGEKPVTRREARAEAEVLMGPQALRLIREGRVPKGDVLIAARLAGIMAAKRTHEMIPLCHPLGLESVEVEARRAGAGVHQDPGLRPGQDRGGDGGFGCGQRGRPHGLRHAQVHRQRHDHPGAPGRQVRGALRGLSPQGNRVALKLLFFAGCSERLGRRQLEVALERPASLMEVLRSVPELTPLLAGNGLSRLKVAVNLQYAETETEVKDGDEVAFLPPFCGG